MAPRKCSATPPRKWWALLQQREQLQQRAAAADRAERERAAARALQEQATEASREGYRLGQEALRRNAFILRLSGTSRKQLQEQADQQHARSNDLQQQAAHHRRAAHQAEQEAAGPTHGYHRSRPPREELWPS